jgi:DNA primase small subunit
LGATKTKTKQLIKILQDDFQFTGLNVNFSGSKGYHVHVRQKEIFSLQKHARIELMDYLSMHELDLPSLGFVFDGKRFRCPLFAQSKGNTQRILREILRLVEAGTEEEWFILTGMPLRQLKNFLENRQRMYNELQHGILPAVPGKSAKTELFWNGILTSIQEKLRLPIDRSTSGDIYKLLRVPDTVHGSTGFVAKSLSLDTWEQFDPFSDALAFAQEKERKIFVHAMPQIRIGDETLDPVQEKELVVSAPVAAFLVGWGAAEIR